MRKFWLKVENWSKLSQKLLKLAMYLQNHSRGHSVDGVTQLKLVRWCVLWAVLGRLDVCTAEYTLM